jgi:RNA polymerase sigma-70 factor (ECF subfamily)
VNPGHAGQPAAGVGTADAEADAVRDAVRAVRRGERDAFSRIVALYQRRVFALSLMLTRDPAGAEDVAQEAFVRAFVHLDAYDARRPFYPWISTIAFRLAQNWLVVRARQRTREGAPVEEASDLPADDHAPDALETLITDESDRRLWRAVSALPSGQRACVILHYRQDLSIKEIASALGVTAGTVKTLLFRARRRLRDELDGYSEERGDV